MPGILKCRVVVIVVLFAAFGTVALADDSMIQIHGFGGWSYGKTNSGNDYLSGRPEGDYRHMNFSLNLEGRITDRLRVVAQSDWEQVDNEHDTKLDYAFAEWQLTKNMRLRAGQVKLPFGLYAETIDVGTLRPFLYVPQGVYGPVGFAGEDYRGVGITGNIKPSSKWSYSYDLYAGGTELEEYLPSEQYFMGEQVTGDTAIETSRNVVGGRFIVHTPVEGLSVGTSAYTGTLTAAHHEATPRRSVMAGHVEYAGGPWTLRSEYAYETSPHDLSARGFYFEPSYRLTDHWQLAMQVDRVKTAFADIDPSAHPSLVKHNEVAAGINYWFSPELVTKLSYHHVSGNLFAGPSAFDYAQRIDSGLLKPSTNLVLFGFDFSF